jgi:hypothetical protein
MFPNRPPAPVTIDRVTPVLAGILLLGVAAAAVYGYMANERERTYRQYLVSGDSSLAQDDTLAAIQAFSGAIALKPESMIGLKRGLTYRRRMEFTAAIRDLRKPPT